LLSFLCRAQESIVFSRISSFLRKHDNRRSNECGAVVGTINAAILKALTRAISDGILVHKFDELDAPEVLTSISEECQRGEPGTTEAGELAARG
jgi:hypothetical protein